MAAAHRPPPLPAQAPPVRTLQERAIARVKYAEHGPGSLDTPSKPAREITRAQADGKLELLQLGVLVHGRFLVPWSNIYWVEFAP